MTNPSSEPSGSTSPRWKALPLALAVLVGVLAGLGAYTFSYAKGLSYLSTDPQACVNCHIMQAQYDGWQKASHHTVAVCVDCHLPQGLIPKYLVKCENGWRHGKLFTTGGFKEPIEVQAAGRKVLEENCRRCHASLVADLPHVDTHSDPGGTCTHCHSAVGHGVRAGLGGPLRDDERRSRAAPTP